MTEAELTSYRQQLLALKKRLGGELSVLEEEALRPAGGEASGGMSDVPVHPADLSADNHEVDVAVDLLENELQTLEEIDAALERIEQGTFGRCEECQQEIPRQRLKIVPYTRYCLQDARKLQGRARK